MSILIPNQSKETQLLQQGILRNYILIKRKTIVVIEQSSIISLSNRKKRLQTRKDLVNKSTEHLITLMHFTFFEEKC